MSTNEEEAIERWLSSPETDEPVPEFVDRELEKPFGFDLSIFRDEEEEEEELSPGFTSRVVAAVLGRASPGSPLQEADPPSNLEPGALLGASAAEAGDSSRAIPERSWIPFERR